MAENVFELSSNQPYSFQRPRAYDAILYGGLAVSVLDGMAAVITTILYGRSPGRMFQSIASGLLGRSSFEGGWPTILLGVALHVLIAFIWTTIYYGASLKIPALIQRALICGPIYGIVVYFAMQIIVLPLSAIRKPVFSFAIPVQSIIVHMICVGLPIALFARRAAKSN